MDMHVIKVGDRRSIVPDLQGDAVVIVPQETVPYLDCIGTDYIYTVTVQYITYGIHPVDQDIIIIVYGNVPARAVDNGDVPYFKILAARIPVRIALQDNRPHTP